MPKAILEFNLPEERNEYEDAVKGQLSAIIIEEIWQRVFRPAFKRGYSNPEINKLIKSKHGMLLVEKLAEIYQEILKEYNE
jgi:hypothetical protein